jgi:mRNA interferase RelE/StbE
VEDLSACPFPTGARKITGSTGSYRIRVGDYRAIYSVLAEAVVVEIIRVRHRREVYRGI